jgi:membrane protease YdiL (CAAX protease family)
LNARAEFAVVVCIAFGYPIFVSILRGFAVLPQKNLSAGNLTYLVLFELAIGGGLGVFLILRGWSAEKIGLRPTIRDTGIGILILVFTTLIWAAIFYVTYFVAPEIVTRIRDTYATLKGTNVSPALAAGVSIFNAAFEEILVTGYVITALKKSGSDWFAINVSTGIRLAYHLYQGQMAVLGILPLGLIYAFWYARSGRLWPLIVAHTLQDIWALLANP